LGKEILFIFTTNVDNSSDLLPRYLVHIFVVGHVLAALMLWWFFTVLVPPTTVLLSLEDPITTFATLLAAVAVGVVLLPPQIGITFVCPLLHVFAPSLQEQYKSERLHLLFSHVKRINPDAVALQEVTLLWWSTWYKRLIISSLEEQGYCHHIACPDLPSAMRLRGTATLANSGLMILSKYPIARHAYHRFSHQATFEAHVVDRGALFAELDLGPEAPRAQLFTAHLASGGYVLMSSLNLDAKTQNAMVGQSNSYGLQQAHELAAFIRAQSTPSADAKSDCKSNGGEVDGIASSPGDSRRRREPFVVLAADLNIRPSHSEYPILAGCMHSLGLEDAWAGSWEPTFGTVDERGRPHEWLMTHHADLKTCKELDYVFHSSGAKIVEKYVDRCAEPNNNAGWQQASDHSAIVATFDIPSRTLLS
jgi:endonuclease/exonuclease/phosphatase family metal-dependent hydrolase